MGTRVRLGCTAVNAKYCDPPTGSVHASIRFCQSGTVSSLNVYINGSSILTKESLIGKECVCHVVWSGNGSLVVNGQYSCDICGLDVTLKDFVLSPGSTPGWGIIQLDDKAFQISMKMNPNLLLENISPEFCLLLRGSGGIDINVTLTCEDPHLPTAVSTARSYGNAASTNTPTKASSELLISLTKESSRIENFYTTPQNSSQSTRNSTSITVLPGLTTAKSASNIKEEIVVAAAAGGFGVGVVVVIVIGVIIFICYKRRIKNKDMQRSSTAPPRDYTELEFNSRDGQNNSHVYNSIDRQNTYVNDAH